MDDPADEIRELRARNAAYEVERQHREDLDAERAKSDDLYAVKLVERIVFGLVALIAIGVVGALMALVLR
jgi:hypothetical protein